MKARLLDIGIIGFAWACAICLLSAVTLIIGYLIYKGLGVVSLALIFGQTSPIDALLLQRPVFDGLFPAIIGTIFLVFISVSIALPLGIGTGIYMAEYASGIKKKLFSLCYDILSSTPSIVIGIFGLSIAIFLHRHFSDRIMPCLLISAVSLAFLILPYLIRTTQVALETLPISVRQTAIALGASKMQNIISVLIPQAISGIVSGIILSIGRCAEDTAVIMLTGVVASAGIPKSLLAGYEALPFYIYYISSQYQDADELARGYGASLILLVICILLFMMSYLIKARLKRRIHTMV